MNDQQNLENITADDKELRTWAMFLHFSLLAGFIIPFAGLIAPIVIWQVKKDEMPEIDAHGKAVVNWLISALIYTAICLVLTIIIIGFPLMIILGLISVVFPIIGGIKANEGKLWKYPLSIEILK